MINIYEKFGNYALDVSKYVLTGFVLATFFGSMEVGATNMYIIGIAVAFVFLLIAIWAYNVQNRKEDKANRNTNNKKRR